MIQLESIRDTMEVGVIDGILAGLGCAKKIIPLINDNEHRIKGYSWTFLKTTGEHNQT